MDHSTNQFATHDRFTNASDGGCALKVHAQRREQLTAHAG